MEFAIFAASAVCSVMSISQTFLPGVGTGPDFGGDLNVDESYKVSANAFASAVFDPVLFVAAGLSFSSLPQPATPATAIATAMAAQADVHLVCRIADQHRFVRDPLITPTRSRDLESRWCTADA